MSEFIHDCSAAAGGMDDCGWLLMHAWKKENRSTKWIAAMLNTNPASIRYNAVRPKPSERAKPKPPPIDQDCLDRIQQRRELTEKFALMLKQTPNGPRKMYPGCQRIAREINCSQEEIETSESTVRRDLKSLGYVNKVCPKGPKRKPGDEENRVARCKVYLRYPVRDLLRIAFSDEKWFDTNDHGTRTEWCRPEHEASRRVQCTWAPRVRVWGCVWKGGRVLVRLPPVRLTGNAYKKYCLMALAAHLKAKGIPPTSLILQYDGDKTHGTDECIRYLATKNLETLPQWPPRSPDLTPIENLWAIIQLRVDSHGPSDPDALYRFIQKEWEAIPQEEVDNLIGSFRRRLRKCIANGGRTITTKSKRDERDM